MKNAILGKMSGEELLMLRILNGRAAKAPVDAELDRRAHAGPPRRSTRIDWSGRIFANRHPARLSPAA